MDHALDADAAAFTPVHSRVLEIARAEPGAAAVISDGAITSYGALAAAACELAAGLQARGVGRGEVVAVLMDRSPDQIAAMLAVMACGGVYAPLEPDTPAARLAQIVDVAAPALLVCDDVRARTSPGLTAVGDLRAEPARFEAPALALDHAAYLIHTSGSTGRPKGVVMPHRGLARLIDWHLRVDPRPGRTVQFTAPSFDVTFQEVFSTLCAGGTLIRVSEEERKDPGKLLDAIDHHEVERVFLPFVALQQLAEAARSRPGAGRSLRQIVTAGERLVSTAALREFLHARPDARLDNHYGPTEAHLVTRHRLDAEPGTWPDLPPIGAAVDGVEVRLLNDALDPVGDGEIGRLFVSGSGLALGYAGDPAGAAARFLPDPFSARPGARMYDTGDLAARGADGAYDFHGRDDDQLKVRGHRVEPAEIERALCALEGVRAAAVTLDARKPGAAILTAHVTADPAASLELRAVREALGHTLPDYMIPGRLLRRETLPLTVSGKIDRRALALVEASDETEPAEDADPRALVRRIWTRVLGHDEFEDDEDFFDVGGDSILAAWVAAELGEALGRPVELSVFLAAASVQELVETLGAASAPARAASRSELVTLEPGDSGQGLILVHPLGGELIAYRALAREIRSRVRVLGLKRDFEPADGREDLGGIAEDHVARITAIQPEGPYMLAGWSFGGLLAYEIARRLEASGRRVAFLGLIDANPVLDPTSGAPKHETALRDALDRVLGAIGGEGQGARGVDALLRDEPEMGRLLGDVVPAGVSPAYLERYLHRTRRGLDAAAGYTPQRYPGAIDLFQPGQVPAERRRVLKGALEPLCGGELRVHSVEGDHFTMLRPPHAAGLACALDAALSAARQRASTQERTPA